MKTLIILLLVVCCIGCAGSGSLQSNEQSEQGEDVGDVIAMKVFAVYFWLWIFLFTGQALSVYD